MSLKSSYFCKLNLITKHLLDFPIPDIVAGMKVPLVRRGDHPVAVEDRVIVRHDVEGCVARMVALESRVVPGLTKDRGSFKISSFN